MKYRKRGKRNERKGGGGVSPLWRTRGCIIAIRGASFTSDRFFSSLVSRDFRGKSDTDIRGFAAPMNVNKAGWCSSRESDPSWRRIVAE